MNAQYNHAIWQAVSHIAEQHGKSCSNTLVNIMIAMNMSPIQFAQIYQSFLDKERAKNDSKK